MFTWTDFYKNFATVLLKYKDDRTSLIEKIKKALEKDEDTKFSPFWKNPTDTDGKPKKDKDGKKVKEKEYQGLIDIDPFTVFGLFNGADGPNRIKIVTALHDEFSDKFKECGLEATIPNDFDGIPVLKRGSNIFTEKNKTADCNTLWDVFAFAIALADDWSDNKIRTNFIDSYNKALNLDGVKFNLSVGLFWIRPGNFVNLDSRNLPFMLDRKLIPENIAKKTAEVTKQGKNPPAGKDYLALVDLCNEELKGNTDKYGYKNFQELSRMAYVFSKNLDIKNLLEMHGQIILHGAPGTGKTFLAKKIIAPMLATPDETHIRFVQFHPGYDYSDFIVGLKPKLVGEEGKEQVAFEWRPGIFKEIAEAAKETLEVEAKEANPNTPFMPSKFVLIIDEINRANLSNVFGEVFSCIEYRFRYQRNDKGGLVKDDKGRPIEENNDGVQLPSTLETKANGTEVRHVREKLVIPENLYIIGTMNDIDRSIESMDFALRRRFAWREITANDSKIIIEEWAAKKGWDSEIEAKLKAAMDALNEYIRGEKELEFGGKDDRKKRKLTLGSEYELGGAYFTKFDGKGDGDEAYEALWENHLKIILNEYLRGEKDKDDILDALYDVYRVTYKVKQAT